MSASQRLPDYLDHMLEAVHLTATYVAGLDKSVFLSDRRTQQAVLMNIVILGEAATKILTEFPAFAEQHSEIPWRTIRAMRNRVAHAYFQVNIELVWETATVALPDLAASLPAVRAAAVSS